MLILTVAYLEQLKAGKDPIFNLEEHPEIISSVDHEIWLPKPAVEGTSA
jgi:hypothetical protein